MMLTVNQTKAVLIDKHDFVAQLSHQLLTCATKVQLIDHALSEELPLSEQTRQEVQCALSTVTKQLVYAGRIASLLDGADGSKEALVCEAINIVELIDEVIGTFILRQVNHSITTNYPDEPLYVWGDAGHLQVVLDNLISNALKYSDLPSSIMVSVEQYSGMIDKGNGHLLVSVTNYGSYVPPEEQEKIFYKSYRFHKSGQPGQGLGLYLSKYLVELHEGQLEVESSPTDGTTFWFTLPLADSSIERLYPERENQF